MTPCLSRVVIAYESESSARDRLVDHGYAAEVAAEIAVYLAQATDLAALVGDLRGEFANEGLAAEFVEIEALSDLFAAPRESREGAILWCQTDGFRYYRGSAVPALARLLGIPRYGAPPLAQHLCQDKFASLSLAAASGLPVSPTLLLDGTEELASIGKADWERAQLFVKPATLGAKIGIFANSRCRGLAGARRLSERIGKRYGDRSLVQPFIEGDDLRVSYMNTGGAFATTLGIARLKRDPRSEMGGAFMTMKDNNTLSGAKNTAGGRGGFGARYKAAFAPKMVDLKSDPHSGRTVAAVTDAATRLARLLRLEDYFSMDFRLGTDGRPVFLEFEVCPAVTIYDFQDYLQTAHGMPLGAALARSMRLAYARHLARVEA
jgi:D-alanine-D-alanine ligase